MSSKRVYVIEGNIRRPNGRLAPGARWVSMGGFASKKHAVAFAKNNLGHMAPYLRVRRIVETDDGLVWEASS